jgi:predicted PurR-regulated permease PerM
VSDQTQPESVKANSAPKAPDPYGALKFRRAFVLLLVVGISILFLMMVGRFLIAVFLAAVLAGVSQPLYRWLKARVVYRRRLASLVTILILILGVALPLAGFLTIVASQALQVGEGVGAWLQGQEGRLDEIEASARRMVLFGTVIDATRGTLNFLLQFFIVLYSLYFFLTGPDVLRRMMSYTPLSPDEEERLLERFVSVTRATLKGSLLIGVLQGALAGIAFWAAGVPGAAFWGTVMVVLSIIPAVGAGLVWIPAVFYLFFAGRAGAAVGLLVWCALVVSTVDNFLRPRLIGRDARMSDLLILLSTLGGIVLFGAVGFVVGPIIAALFVTVWQIYGEVFRDWLPERPRALLQDREGTPTKEGPTPRSATA